MTGALEVSSTFFVDSSVPYFGIKGVKSFINLFVELSSFFNPDYGMLMLAIVGRRFFLLKEDQDGVLLNRGLACCPLCDWPLHGYTMYDEYAQIS